MNSFTNFSKNYVKYGNSYEKSIKKYKKAMMSFGKNNKITKQQLINHLKNDIYCRVGVSKISGVGVIAIRDIPKGINPFKTLEEKEDEIITVTNKDLRVLHPKVKKIVSDFFGNDDSSGKKVYDILATGPNNINLSFYMNHSDNNNISVKESTHSNYLDFVTNRYIKKGEELFINYNDYVF